MRSVAASTEAGADMKRWITRGLLACLVVLLVVGVGGFAYVHALDLQFMHDGMRGTRG
jgi:hypothetical protein